MSDRLNEISARLDAAKKEALRAEARVSRSGPTGTATITYGTTDDALREFSTHAPADIAWLLAENEALREQIGFLREEIGDSRLVVRSPQERVWEVWRTTRDEKVATFRTKREATFYVEGGGDA